MIRAGSSSAGVLVLIWVVGFNLRAVILGVAPVLPAIRSEFGLSFALAGALTALPVLCLAAGSLPGALAASRVGPRRLVGLCLLGLCGGALARLLPPVQAWIFIGTAAFSFGIAFAQPAMAALIRSWLGSSVQIGTTVYALGLTTGGLAGASATSYIAAALGWRASFVIWAALVLLAAGLWLALAPRPQKRQHEPQSLGRLAQEAGVWWAAVLFGAQSFIYFSAATWIPFLLQGSGHGYVAAVLFAMNAVLIPPAVILTRVRWEYATSGRLYVGAGAIATAGAAGLLFGSTSVAWLFALMIGLGTGLTFTGSMGLPSILARSATDAAGYSALTLTAGYALAFAGPLIGGFLLDATHSLRAPFWPILAGSAAIPVVGLARIAFDRPLRSQPPAS